MNFIPLYVQSDEMLICACGKITKDYAYLVHYERKENRTGTTAYVRCIKCLREEMSEELDRIFGKEKS